MTDMIALFHTIDSLSPDEKRHLLEYLEHQKPEETPSQGLIFDMQPGAMGMSPDFDDELPDEFWPGKDA